MGAVVGIDLGTTNTVVAAAKDASVVALPDESGSTLIPSVVSFLPSGAVLVGNAASERRSVEARNTIYSIKRLIGRTWGSPEVEQAVAKFPFELREGPGRATFVVARGETYTLPEIGAFVLRKAKSIAELELEEPVDRAVITVPANFNDLQRAATKVAGRVAGLEILRVLNEPIAAAMAFGHTHGNRECIAVYDLGGGTFDFTLLRLTEDVFEVLATAGDTYLGGDDIDAAIANQIAHRVGSSTAFDAKAHPDTFERLRSAAEKIKVALSTASDARVRLRDYEIAAADGLEFSMNRSELDAIEAPLLERTLEICRSTLSLANVSLRDIGHVLLVGGATRDPYIRRGAERFFERSARSEVDAHEVVALGAARQAMALTRLRATASGIPIAPAPRQTLDNGESPDLARKRTDSGVGDPGIVAPARISAPPPEQLPSPSAPTTQTLGSRDRRTTGIGLGPLLDPAPAAASSSVSLNSRDDGKHGPEESPHANPLPPSATVAAPTQPAVLIPKHATAKATNPAAHSSTEGMSPNAIRAELTPSDFRSDTLQPPRATTGISVETASPRRIPDAAVALTSATPRVDPALPAIRTNPDHRDLPAPIASAVVTAASTQSGSGSSTRNDAATARGITAPVRALPAPIATAVVSTTANKESVAGAPAARLGTAALRAKTSPMADLPSALATAIVDSSGTAIGTDARNAPQASKVPRVPARAVHQNATGAASLAAPNEALSELPLVGIPQQRSETAEQPRVAAQHSKTTPGAESVGSPSPEHRSNSYDDARDNEPTAIRQSLPGSLETNKAIVARPTSSLVAEDHDSEWDLLAPASRTAPQQLSASSQIGPASSTPESRLSEAEIRARYGDLPLIVGGRRVGAPNTSLLSSSATAPPPREPLFPMPGQSGASAIDSSIALSPEPSKHDKDVLSGNDRGQRSPPAAGGSAGLGSVGKALSTSDEVTVTKRVQAPSLTEKSTPFARNTKPLPVLSLEPEEIESKAIELLSASPQLDSPQLAQIAADEQLQKPPRMHSTRPSARQNIAELELPIPGIPQRTEPLGLNRPSPEPDPLVPPYPAAVDPSTQWLDEAKPPSRSPEPRQNPGSTTAGTLNRAAAHTLGGAALGATVPFPTRPLLGATAAGSAETPHAPSEPLPPLLPSSPKGASLRPALLMEATPLSLCVETVGGYVDVLVTRNSPVPCERTCEFVTARDNQQTVIIRIAQGESRLFRENALLGEVQLTGIPPRSRGQSRIAVTFGIDSDGILHVRAIDRATGVSALTDFRLSGAPTATEIVQMSARQAGKGLQ